MSYSFMQIARSPDNEILELLNNNIIGTPGYGMLYQHLGVLNKIYKIADPYFVSLVKDKKVVGTCCFCSRPTVNNGKNIHSYYVRYFSFKNSFRRKHISEKPVYRNSLIREAIKNVLAGNGLNKGTNDQFYHYAYVDPRNVRSVTLCNEFGFEAVRQYTTIIFNRINPRRLWEKIILEASPELEHPIKKLLLDFYKNYNMLSLENLFGARKYYYIKDPNGNIVAGAQVNPDHWKIHSLPGVSGKLILNTFTHLPYLNRLFNKQYRFITLEAIYCAPGHEYVLQKLFEGLLAKYQVNSAIAVADADSNLYTILKSLDLGLVDKLNKEVRGDVICKFSNFSDDEKNLIRKYPAYISGIDVT